MEISDKHPANIRDLVRVARQCEKVTISQLNKGNVQTSRKIVEQIIESKQIKYGITTGFGAFKNKVIDRNQTEELQRNLIMSHSVGVGKPLPSEVVRGIMFVMVNYLSKGHSGIKFETLNTLVEMLNKGVHPLVPEKGSVGSSGDLAPSAHIALVLIGEGEAEYKGRVVSGPQAMKLAGIKPVKLSAKEGLAIINNTSAMTSISSLLMYDAEWLMKVASISAALSLQALMGTDVAYDLRIHNLKPHQEQINVAKFLNKLLEGSTYVNRERIQEAYSFRCVPQVHGAIGNMLNYSKSVIATELNSVTDNPLIFTGDDSEVISGGNFHGESVAIAMDAAGIALCELGDISERRLAALLDPATNNCLPAFLIEKGGVNSGLMITQYTAASLVSENKVLAHPASVDSIPTSANIEDIVSMGTIAARKAREIFENVALVLSIELLASCQAINLRKKQSNDKLKLGPLSDKVFRFIRTKVPYFEDDTEYRKFFMEIRKNLESIALLPLWG